MSFDLTKYGPAIESEVIIEKSTGTPAVGVVEWVEPDGLCLIHYSGASIIIPAHAIVEIRINE